MFLEELWQWGATELAGAGVDDARWQAELLLRGTLGVTRAKLMAYPELPIAKEDIERFRDAIRKRSLGLPVQYILGYQEFYGRRLVVTPAVLIPRPETEVLVEEVLTRARARHNPRILDLCTGTGAVGLTLAAEMPQARVVATDISPAALAVAAENAANLGLLDRCELRQGDLFAPVLGEVFDILVSNPPYIESEVVATLSREVQAEPRGALDGGRDGLRFYRRIAAGLKHYLAPGGLVAVEIGHGQGAEVVRLFEQGGLTSTALVHDLAGKERVVLGHLP